VSAYLDNVKSSLINTISYNSNNQELFVVFRQGGLYAYSGVPEDLVNKFLSATSYGKFFWTNIRDRFPTRKIKAW
jgi:hypothetical protein